MARINYGKPLRTVTEHRVERRDVLGPGIAVAPTQRTAELVVDALRQSGSTTAF